MAISQGLCFRFGLFAALVFLFSATSCVVVQHQTSQAGEATPLASDEFDPEAYVEARWQDQVLPEFLANAVEVRQVLALLESDAESARAQWGRRKEDSAPFAFVVRGVATILDADLESSASTVRLALKAPVEGTSVRLQIGPVIRGSAIRDALSFVRFGDFTNQVDFANLSRALNSRVRDSVVAGLDRDLLVGRTATFVGAFTERDDGEVLITPVVFEVEP